MRRGPKEGDLANRDLVGKDLVSKSTSIGSPRPGDSIGIELVLDRLITLITF